MGGCVACEAAGAHLARGDARRVEELVARRSLVLSAREVGLGACRFECELVCVLVDGRLREEETASTGRWRTMRASRRKCRTGTRGHSAFRKRG